MRSRSTAVIAAVVAAFCLGRGGALRGADCHCAHGTCPLTTNWYDVDPRVEMPYFQGAARPGASFPGLANGAAGAKTAAAATTAEAAKTAAFLMMGPSRELTWHDSRRRYFHAVPTAPVYGVPPQLAAWKAGELNAEDGPKSLELEAETPPPEVGPPPEDDFPPGDSLDGQYSQAATWRIAETLDGQVAPEPHAHAANLRSAARPSFRSLRLVQPSTRRTLGPEALLR